MKQRAIVLTVSLALVAGPVAPPTAAFADPFPWRPVVGGHRVAPSFAPHPFVPHPFFQDRFFHRAFFHPFSPFGVIAWPVVVYAPPAVYGPAASYALAAISDPPIRSSLPPVYSPPVTGPVPVAPPAPPSPMPSVIEYPTGRYELRGDGDTTPYRWVWIPNPPPPPEPSWGVLAPPAPPVPRDQPPARRSQVYHWTDPQGVEHWTDRADAVPDQYRAPAKAPTPS